MPYGEDIDDYPQLHEHRFNTVVEWKTTRDYGSEAASNNYPYIRETRATKVMCSVCGETKDITV